MATIPVRNLAERGVLLDPHPYDIPPNAFTLASNVRFEVGKARRSPIFRKHIAGLQKDPTFVAGYHPSTGFDEFFIGNQDASIARIRDFVATDVTPTGRTLSSSDAGWNATFLGDVLYFNRLSHVPAAFLPGATKFVNLPNWNASWRTRTLRAFKDFLFAINLTKGSTAYPTSIAWSDATLAGQAPGSWDPAATNLANEVLLASLDSPLVDGVALKNSLILYSGSQVVALDYTGNTEDNGQNLFTNRTVFTNGGMIAPNCAVEVDGLHYVFGVNDIYKHDGMQQVSIANGRVREWLFSHLNVKLAERCFVHHMPKFSEIMFGFVSGDDAATFKSPTRCNRALVYNYASDTWAPVDLPNVSAGTLVNLDPTITWANAGTRTWSGTGGTWYDLRDGYEKHSLFACSPLAGGPSGPKLLAYDHMDRGALPAPYDAECNGKSFLERVGIDMDEAGSDLTTYKICKRILPQVTMFRNIKLRVQVGSSMTPSGAVAWGPVVLFDPNVDYKVDMRQGGRYLAVRFFVDEPADYEISGFDAEIVQGGRR